MREAQRQGKERLRRLKVLVDGRKTDFWTALKSELDFSIKARESEKERRERSNPCDDPVKEWGYGRGDRAAIDAYSGIKAVVDDAERRMLSVNEKIREYGERIKDIEDRAKKRAERKPVTTTREEV